MIFLTSDTGKEFCCREWLVFRIFHVLSPCHDLTGLPMAGQPIFVQLISLIQCRKVLGNAFVIVHLSYVL